DGAGRFRARLVDRGQLRGRGGVAVRRARPRAPGEIALKVVAGSFFRARRPRHRGGAAHPGRRPRARALPRRHRAGGAQRRGGVGRSRPWCSTWPAWSSRSGCGPGCRSAGTGTSGFRGISGRPGSPAWWGGVLFPLAVLTGVVAPVLVLTGATPPVAMPAAIAGTGLVVAVAGLAVVLIAQAARGESWRIGVDEDERTELVTRGPFARVRNPVFTGMVAVSAG